MMATTIAGLGGYNRRAQGADGSSVLREGFERGGQTVATACALRTLGQLCGTFTMGVGPVPTSGEDCRVESALRIDAFQIGERSSFGSQRQ